MIKQVLKKCTPYIIQKYKTIRSFGTEICHYIIAIEDTFEEQMNLKIELNKPNQYTKPKHRNKRRKRRKHYL